MGLGSLWWIEVLRLELCDEEVEEEEVEAERMVDEEDEEVCDEAEEELEVGATLLIKPVNRPRMGSAQRLLLHVVAGSRVKRPV